MKLENSEKIKFKLEKLLHSPTGTAEFKNPRPRFCGPHVPTNLHRSP